MEAYLQQLLECCMLQEISNKKRRPNSIENLSSTSSLNSERLSPDEDANKVLAFYALEASNENQTNNRVHPIEVHNQTVNALYAPNVSNVSVNASNASNETQTVNGLGASSENKSKNAVYPIDAHIQVENISNDSNENQANNGVYPFEAHIQVVNASNASNETQTVNGLGASNENKANNAVINASRPSHGNQENSTVHLAETLIQAEAAAIEENVQPVAGQNNELSLIGVDTDAFRERRQLLSSKEVLVPPENTNTNRTRSHAPTKANAPPQSNRECEYFSQLKNQVYKIINNYNQVELEQQNDFNSNGIEFRKTNEVTVLPSSSNNSVPHGQELAQLSDITDNYAQRPLTSLPQNGIQQKTDYPIISPVKPNLQIIGPHGTVMTTRAYSKINWNMRPANVEKNAAIEENVQPVAGQNNELSLIGVDTDAFRERRQLLSSKEVLVPPENTNTNRTRSHAPTKANAPPQSNRECEYFSQLKNRVYKIINNYNQVELEQQNAFNSNGIEFRKTNKVTVLPSSSNNSVPHGQELAQLSDITDNYAQRPLTSSPQNGIQQETDYPIISPVNPNLLIIGPHGTVMTTRAYSKINWNMRPANVTRKMLMALFDRDTLATHNLTGRASPAFRDIPKAEKKRLDADIVSDIITLVTGKKNVSPKEVRTTITTKCFDECKSLKTHFKRQLKIANKDNSK